VKSRKVLGLVAVAVACALLWACSPGSTPPSVVISAPAAEGTSAVAVAVQPSSLGTTRPPQPYDASQLDPRVTEATVRTTIGISGWASRARPPSSVTGPIKRRLMREHRYNEPLSAYELDHFIPLGVGGSSDLSNLWLEPIVEARAKDHDEALVHKKVTSGEWTLQQGQQYIRDHWTIHYAQ
jgi:hypothetical protein